MSLNACGLIVFVSITKVNAGSFPAFFCADRIYLVSLWKLNNYVMDLDNFDFSADVWKKPSAPVIDNAAVKAAKETAGAKVDKAQRNKRRLVACVELSDKFLYRRAWGEKQLFDVLAGQLPAEGRAFHILTNGDVDALSFLQYLQTHHVVINHLIISTWVIAAEDILYITEQCEAGKIKKFDCYVGEIFPNQYRIEWKMLTDFFASNEAGGRLGHFKNHAKIIACEYELNGEKNITLWKRPQISTQTRVTNLLYYREIASYGRFTLNFSTA